MAKSVNEVGLDMAALADAATRMRERRNEPVEELAARIRSAVAALNGDIERAASRGVRVEVDVEATWTMHQKWPMQQLEVTVSQEVARLSP